MTPIRIIGVDFCSKMTPNNKKSHLLKNMGRPLNI